MVLIWTLLIGLVSSIPLAIYAAATAFWTAFLPAFKDFRIDEQEKRDIERAAFKPLWGLLHRIPGVRV